MLWDERCKEEEEEEEEKDVCEHEDDDEEEEVEEEEDGIILKIFSTLGAFIFILLLANLGTSPTYKELNWSVVLLIEISNNGR